MGQGTDKRTGEAVGTYLVVPLAIAQPQEVVDTEVWISREGAKELIKRLEAGLQMPPPNVNLPGEN